ncbi:hypothetical protein MTR67_023183 [Solanum verrucosum]|uniref:Uncharacterized protein n=1 Tax=Solanum verrucosum TaxID=315347 RepID=A0AAF0TYG9_SOLVR|nr:hypothetical protein MTR67_023183 [Solanum verrucosum]
MSIQYHLSKVNVEEDVVSRLSIGSVAHLKDGKNELVSDIHRLGRLGVRLVHYNEGGVVFQNWSKSYFLSDVKPKQDLDQASVFRHASSLHETDSQTVNGSTVRTGTLTVSIYGSTVQSVDEFTDRQWPPWFHTLSDFPDLPSMPSLLIYDHHLRSVTGPTDRRSPP